MNAKQNTALANPRRPPGFPLPSGSSWEDSFGRVRVHIILTVDIGFVENRVFDGRPLWHASVSVRAGQKPKAEWDEPEKILVERALEEALRGVGDRTVRAFDIRKEAALHRHIPLTAEEKEELPK